MYKHLFRIFSIFAGFVLLICAAAFVLSPRLPEVNEGYKPVSTETLKQNFEVTYDFEDPISFPQNVDYSRGKKAMWYPKGEAPMLKKLVDKGELPSVAERVGSEPLVLKGIDGVGKYGGIWLRVGNDLVQGRIGQISLGRWSPGGYPRVMNVAKSIDHSKDWKSFTVHLRKGMKWSDGHPFTTEDVKFYIESWEECPALFKNADGTKAKVTFVDPKTFKVEYNTPKGDFYEKAGTCYYPAHYLRQYHPKLGDTKKIKELMGAYELSSPQAVYSFMRNKYNPELPSLYPWIYRSYSAVDPQTYVRNPYFWAVDEKGNQLPYIDAIQTKEVDIKMLPIRAAQARALFRFAVWHFQTLPS